MAVEDKVTKKNGFKNFFLALVFGAGLLFPMLSHGGGPVHGAKAAAMGSAFVAVADDPSAILFNPAGISSLDGTRIYTGWTAMSLSSSYTRPTGGSEDSEFQVFVVPNFYITTDTGFEDITLGFGVYAPFGIGGRKWSREGLTRYVSTMAEIGTMEIGPTISWRPVEKLSVAAGPGYMKVYSIGEMMIDQSMFGEPDGEMRLDGDGDGWGYRAGVLFEANDVITLGFAYRSPVEVDIDGTVELTAIATPLQGAFGGGSYTTGADTIMELPATWGIGVAYKPVDEVEFALDLEWVMWSSFKNATVDFEDEVAAAGFVDSTAPKDWDDVLTVKLGADWRVSEKLSLRGGYAYVPTPVPSSTLDPSHPDSDQHNFSAGFGYIWGKFDIEFFYMAGIFEDREIDNQILDGEYENYIHYLGSSLGYRF